MPNPQFKLGCSHWDKYHQFRCRRCAMNFHRSQVLRTLDGRWICKRCKHGEDEIARKAPDARLRCLK